jgi:hypothetical protein
MSLLRTSEAWFRWVIGRAAPLAILLVPVGAAGQQAAGPPTQTAGPDSAMPREILQLIESQQKMIEQQSRELQSLKQQLEEMRALMLPRDSAPPPSPSAGDATAAESQQPVRESGAQLFFPELPPDVITAGDFPRSFKIPGTDGAFRIGGFARGTWVTSFKPQQVHNKFVTQSIPVDVIPTPVNGVVDVTVAPSRFDLDVRTPTGVGYMRAYIETDFDGSGTTLRLRHAYGQWRRFLFGQTWSTFEDPEAAPPGIDFEGLNARVDVRQPLIRWSWAAAEQVRVAFALENPDSEITGATGVNNRPDLVSHLRWDTWRGGHIQLGGVFRQIRGYPGNQTDDVVQAFGWGANVAGQIPSPFWRSRDQILFQYNRGTGIGRYVKDLQSEGGQDGVFDPATNRIRVIPVSAGYVGYDHWWHDQFHSAFTVGVVDVSTLDIQSGDTLSMTRRYSGNFIWLPILRIEFVAEFLYGVRVNKDGHSAGAAQTQIGGTFRF